MKRKGFTLIELLAVIVILAIIALIATPIVMNTIEKSKKGATERSAENYINAVDTMIATHKLETGEMLPNGTYNVDSGGNLIKDSNTYTVEVDGTKPKSGSTVRIENGRVATTSTDINLKYDTYAVKYDTAAEKLVASKQDKKIVTVSFAGMNFDIDENMTFGEFINSNDNKDIVCGGVSSKLVLENNVVGCQHPSIGFLYMELHDKETDDFTRYLSPLDTPLTIKDYKYAVAA